MPPINKIHSGNILLIDREFVELKDDTKYAFLLKLIKLVKKPFNLTKTEKKKTLLPNISFFDLFH